MKKVVLPFLLSILLLIVVIALNFIAFREMQEHNWQTEESRLTIQQFDRVSLQLKSAQMYTPSFHSDFSELYSAYKSDADSLQNSLQQLKQLVKDNDSQKQIVDTTIKLIHLHLPALLQKNIHELIESGEGWRIAQLGRVNTLLQKGLAIEEEQLQNRKKELHTFTQLNNFLSILMGALALLIVGYTFYKHFFIAKKTQFLEGFLESILDTSQSAIIFYKAIYEKRKVVDFRVDYVNKAVARALNTEPDEVLGKKLSEIDAYIPKSELWELYLQVMTTGKSMVTEHFFHHRGIERWFNISIAKLDNGLRVAFQDISKLKNYELELKKNIAALEHSNRELEEYAYAASHDLQEPLRKIRTFGSVLQDTQQKNLDTKGQQQLQKMLESAERMSLLIKDLLAFSSVKKEQQFEHVDMNNILKNVLTDLEVLIVQKKAVITHDRLPTIKAIPVQMNQLFYNLLNNALKFSKQDVPPQIRIACRILPVEEAKALFESDHVSFYEMAFVDNGIGFNEEFADQIFGMFKRLHDKRHYTGSGIGLALCKKVIENHHGKIIAKSVVGEGTCIYVYLPKQPPTA